jgi:lysozyme
MQISANGINLIKSFEGFVPKAYQDIVGVWTIGYGTTKIDGKRVTPGMSVTEEEATNYLITDVRYFEDVINRLVKVMINQNQFDALVSFVYNLGETNFAKSTLLKKINSLDFAGAQAEFIKWNKAGGKVVSGLTRRREAEARLFASLQ